MKEVLSLFNVSRRSYLQMQRVKKCMQVYDLPGKVLGPDPASSPKPPLLSGKPDREESHRGRTSGLGTEEKKETLRHSSMGQAAALT